MKKIVAGLLALAAAAAVVTGCSRIGTAGGDNPSQNSLYIEGDGSVRWASVETYDQGDYTEDELKASAGQKISSFNSSLGKDASFENAEGSDKLPVGLVSVKLGNGKSVLITEYDTPGRLIEFAQEIGDHNVPFIQLDTGRAAAMSGELKEASFKDEKGQPVDQDTALKDGQKLVVKAEGQGIVVSDKGILYISDNCLLKDASTVQTPEEGIGYIILK